MIYIARTPSKGKENIDVKDKKNVSKDDNDEEEETEEKEPIQPKKRRLIIPDEESGEDSGDEFKPGLCFLLQLCHNLLFVLEEKIYLISFSYRSRR